MAQRPELEVVARFQEFPLQVGVVFVLDVFGALEGVAGLDFVAGGGAAGDFHIEAAAAHLALVDIEVGVIRVFLRAVDVAHVVDGGVQLQAALQQLGLGAQLELAAFARLQRAAVHALVAVGLEHGAVAGIDRPLGA